MRLSWVLTSSFVIVCFDGACSLPARPTHCTDPPVAHVYAALGDAIVVALAAKPQGPAGGLGAVGHVKLLINKAH